MSASAALSSKRTQKPSLFILQHRTRRVVAQYPKDYDALQLAIRRYFPEIPLEYRISYHTNELEISKGAPVEIMEDVWDVIVPTLTCLTVEAAPPVRASNSSKKRAFKEEESDCDTSCDENSAETPNPPSKKRRVQVAPPSPPSSSQTADTHVPAPKKKKITLHINQFEGGGVQLHCSPTTSIRSILSAVHKRMGLDPESWRAQWESHWLTYRDTKTIGEYGIKDGAQMTLFRYQIGGKPVIYLFPPEGAEVDACVKLYLVPEWRFSAIYPVVPIEALESKGQALQWNVKASSDGTLLETNSGLEAAYLFWEAEAAALQSSLPPPPRPTDDVFVPTCPHLEPSNSVVLEVTSITPYIDSVLKALGLHTEARTSFITYWLPSFLKHTHIALRFLPQTAYEHAAPLDISPKPDVIVRVFMLFKGLNAEYLASTSAWTPADNDMDTTRWKKVVGIDEERSLSDRNLFRVLEWGGMEVVS